MCNDIGTGPNPATLPVWGGGHDAVMHNAAVLREILDAQREMICRFSADGKILYVNRAYAETLGRTPDDLAGQKIRVAGGAQGMTMSKLGGAPVRT